jgi:hypothetical protein
MRCWTPCPPMKKAGVEGDPFHEGPFDVQKMVHYDAKQKAGFHAAVEELVAQGLVEKRDDSVILTAKDQQAIA